MTVNSNLAPARVVIQASELGSGSSTQVVFALNRPFTWIGDRTFRLKRGSFRTDTDFLLVDEPVRPLVFDLLDRPENIGVMALGIGPEHIRLELFNAAAGDLEIYVARMRKLLTEIFGLDETTTVYLVTEKFGTPQTAASMINAIAAGWPNAISVTDDADLAYHISVTRERAACAAALAS